jgi:hypothetical protein
MRSSLIAVITALAVWSLVGCSANSSHHPLAAPTTTSRPLDISGSTTPPRCSPGQLDAYSLLDLPGMGLTLRGLTIKVRDVSGGACSFPAVPTITGKTSVGTTRTLPYVGGTGGREIALNSTTSAVGIIDYKDPCRPPTTFTSLTISLGEGETLAVPGPGTSIDCAGLSAFESVSQPTAATGSSP